MSPEKLADEVEQALARHGVTSSRKPTPAADVVMDVPAETSFARVRITIAYAAGCPRDHRVAQRAAKALRRWIGKAEITAETLAVGESVTVREKLPPEDRGRIVYAFYQTMTLVAYKPIPVGERRRLEIQAYSQAVKPMLKAILSGMHAEEGAEQARAYEAMVSHPEPFGRCFAYVVFGANAGFSGAEEFHRASIDDYMNRTAEGLGFTGCAELHDDIDGWWLSVNRYR